MQFCELNSEGKYIEQESGGEKLNVEQAALATPEWGKEVDMTVDAIP